MDEDLKKFRKKHKCRLCLYYRKLRNCQAELVCPLDPPEEFGEKKTCPLDTDGSCPYKNESGTCFGFCWKKILKEHNERKKYEKDTEEKKNE